MSTKKKKQFLWRIMAWFWIWSGKWTINNNYFSFCQTRQITKIRNSVDVFKVLKLLKIFSLSIFSLLIFGKGLEGQFTLLRISCRASCWSLVNCVMQAWNTSLLPCNKKSHLVHLNYKISPNSCQYRFELGQ